MADLKLKALISVANKASGPLRAINADLNKMRAPIRTLSRQVKALDRASGLRELRRGIGGVTREMARMGAIGAGAAAAVFAGVNKLSKTGDEIIKFSNASGIATDELQEWRFVAERTGVPVTALNKSMLAFTKRMGEARNGTGELFSLLNKTNPEFLQQLLAIEDNAEAFEFLVNGMGKLETQQKRILLADKAFSQSGRQLVKINAETAESIAKMRKEARDYGGVLDKETLLQSAQFQDEMTNVGVMVKGVAFALGSEMIPAIKDLLVGLRKWYLANKEAIKPEIAKFAKQAAASIKEFAKWVVNVAPVVGRFIQSIGGLKTVAIGLGLVLAGPLLSAVAALGAALLATPLGLFITGITLLTKLGLTLYDNFELVRVVIDSIGDSIFGLLKGIASANNKLQGLINDAKSLGSNLFNGGDLFAAVPKTGNESGRNRGQQKSLIQSANSAGALGQGQPPTAEVAGKIQVVIDSEGVPRVKSAKSANPKVGFDVDAGVSFAAAL